MQCKPYLVAKSSTRCPQICECMLTCNVHTMLLLCTGRKSRAKGSLLACCMSWKETHALHVCYTLKSNKCLQLFNDLDTSPPILASSKRAQTRRPKSIRHEDLVPAAVAAQTAAVAAPSAPANCCAATSGLADLLLPSSLLLLLLLLQLLLLLHHLLLQNAALRPLPSLLLLLVTAW